MKSLLSAIKYRHAFLFPKVPQFPYSLWKYALVKFGAFIIWIPLLFFLFLVLIHSVRINWVFLISHSISYEQNWKKKSKEQIWSSSFFISLFSSPLPHLILNTAWKLYSISIYGLCMFMCERTCVYVHD